MADQNIDDLKRQIADLANKVQAFGGAKIQDINKYVESFGGGIEGATKALDELRKSMKSLDTDTDYFYSVLRNITSELRPLGDASRAITRQFSMLGNLASKLKLDQDGINKLNKVGLQNLERKVGEGRKELETRLSIGQQVELELAERVAIQQRERDANAGRRYTNEHEFKSLKEKLLILERSNNEAEAFLGMSEGSEDSARKFLEVVRERLEVEKGINKNLGITGVLSKGIVTSLGKLGISSEYFDGLVEDIQLAASKMENINGKAVLIKDKVAPLKAAFKGIGTGLMEGLKDPMIAIGFLIAEFKFFFNAALAANKQIVEIGKTLGTDASSYRKELVNIQSTSDNINVTTAKLVEAQAQLTESTGFASQLTQDQLETQIMLTKQYGLAGDEAANVNRFAILNNKTSKETLDSFNKGLVATRNQVRVGINMKAALVEAAKVSGQLAANLGFNPERIAAAIVQTKALGLALEQAKEIGHKMLDFESSISNELDAQLITGENINLDEARILALNGDHVGLAKEITRQGITLNKFTKMNVLQQESIANALGMSADGMADMLTKQQLALASGKSFAAITEEENKKAMERQNIEERFAATMDKIKSIVAGLVEGPMGQLLDSLSVALTKVATLINMINRSGLGGALLGATTGAAVGSLFGGIGAAPGALIGGVLGLGAEHLGDAQMGEGPKVISTPQGTYKLNDQDSLIAGTDLFGKQSTSQPSIDLSMLSLGFSNLEKAIKNQRFESHVNLKLDNGVEIAEWLDNNRYAIA